MSVLQESVRFSPATSIAPFVSGWGYRSLQGVLVFGVLGSIAGVLYTTLPLYLETGVFAWYAPPARLFVGVFMLALVGVVSLLFLRFFFRSYYFRGLDNLLQEDIATSGVVYEVAAIVLDAPDDVTAGFVHSPFGMTVFDRVGISHTSIQEEFLQTNRQQIAAATLHMPDTQLTLVTLFEIILQTDEAFVAYLQTKGIQAEHLRGAAIWTHREHVAQKRRERWWSKDQLSKRTGIGRDFIYGVPYTLDTYSKPIQSGTVYHERATRATVHPEVVEAVEQQLVQADHGNVLLVGEAGVGKLDIVAVVAERLARGEALGAVLAPQVRLLDTERLLADAGDAVAFERIFLKLLHEAAAAGNTVMVIDDLPTFMENAARHGVAVDTLLDEYLSKTALRVIATSTPTLYHQSLASNGQFLRFFHVAMVAEPDADATLQILETLATTERRLQGVQCTYQALARIATAAERYVVNGVMPDKAIHLFDEIIAAATDRKVTVGVVDAYIGDSTGIPVGPLTATERTQLLELETVLHERIVGQDEAVSAISGVMRRARADIQASDKPLGSFLFMGPTGVGKTETAKALAATFFQSETHMHRFDMSEYSSDDALTRLIGTPDRAGTLPAALTEQPYAVVLLDEFEKAAVSVHDVFLQILDEGQFTDGRGKRVNARNTIIIATSNAGSDMIMNWSDNDADTKKQALIEHVIATGIYKPELINRFDEVVLFAPLTESEQQHIAKQLLDELADRVQKKGYTLVVTDALLARVTELGYSADFGARPMRRAIQTAVEDAIAKRVIAGSLNPGDTITFTDKELAEFSV